MRHPGGPATPLMSAAVSNAARMLRNRLTRSERSSRLSLSCRRRKSPRCRTLRIFMKAVYGKTVRLSIASRRGHPFKPDAPGKELGLTGPTCCTHGSRRMPALNDLTPPTLTKQKPCLGAREVERRCESPRQADGDAAHVAFGRQSVRHMLPLLRERCCRAYWAGSSGWFSTAWTIVTGARARHQANNPPDKVARPLPLFCCCSASKYWSVKLVTNAGF